MYSLIAYGHYFVILSWAQRPRHNSWIAIHTIDEPLDRKKIQICQTQEATYLVSYDGDQPARELRESHLQV